MVRGISVVLALLGAIAGCAPRDVPRGSKGGDGTLRLSFPGEPRSLNPNLGPTPDEFAMIVAPNLFNRLVSLGADGTLLPELAESWDESDDGLAYTFHLRADVRWHDGRPFSSEDVRITFARVVHESSNRDLAARIAGVTAPDARTVVIRLTEPWAAFLTRLGWFGTWVLPAHIYGSAPWQGHPANDTPTGTGPFRFVRWDRGQRIVLAKNTDYFGPGPYADEIEVLVSNGAAEAVIPLKEGRAHLLIGRPPAEALPSLRTLPHLRVVTAPGDGRTYLAFNLRRAPLQDGRIRRAINLALDRRALVEGPLGGLGAPAFGFYTPTVSWAYNGDARAPAHDRLAARRLLAEALTAPLRLTLVVPEGGSAAALAGEVARQLDAVGIRVSVQRVTAGEYFARLMETRDFDLVMLSGSHGPDPESLASRFASNGAFQFMGYANAELDELLARAGREGDVATRARAYHRAQEILAADLPVAPLTESVRVTVFRAGLRGLPQVDARGLVPEYAFNLIRLADH